MQNVTAQQAQQVTSQANADFRAYQQSVINEDNTAVRQVSQQLTARANVAYRQRVTQLQEKESQLALELSQQDASKRLQLQMQLNNLALSDSARKQLRDQLGALDANEAATVNAQRKSDAQQLAAYQKQLRDQTNSQIATQVSKIRAQTQAKLQSRRNEVSQQVSSQLQGLQPAAVPSNLPAATRDKLAQIDKQYKSQFQADAQRTIQEYQTTKADLDAQYAALQGADGVATGAANKQLTDLQRQRDDLYNKMVDQVKHDAASVAAKRGLQVVFISVVAAPGGIDLTDDVEKDIESLHQ
ncbi:MAG TPA: OmpH family outer membrane protein, partial [Candidatus Baltobacteraceae bacterium]|nr:OmpH family outer membrane protein [Candidatus Baltobacteraceae bacterium]